MREKKNHKVFLSITSFSIAVFGFCAIVEGMETHLVSSQT